MRTLTSEQRTAFYGAVIAASAALVGAAIGAVGGVYSQSLSAVSAQQLSVQGAKREACANFIAASEKTRLVVNSMYLISLYQGPTPKAEYVDREKDLNEALPDAYGKQAVLQLTTARQAVSDQSNAVTNSIVDQINYVEGVIGSAGNTVQPGTIAPDKMSELGVKCDEARNKMIDLCHAEIVEG